MSHTTVDGVRVVALCGELDHAARAVAEDALRPRAGEAPPRTVADLTDVTFMDSSGINVLITAHLAARNAEGWLRVSGARKSVLRVLELVGVDSLIPCRPTLREALEN